MAYRSKFKGKEIDDRLDLVKELSEEIKDKQDNIEDLEDIRDGANKGATALQSIPEEYVTETELEGKGYATVTQVNEKQDAIPDLDTIRTNSEKGATALQEIPSEYITESELNNKGFLTQHQDISHLATKSELTSKLNNKVDKVNGKQLSTEDFTTALKNKLSSLSNYDDSTIKNSIGSLQSQINTLINGDVSTAIETFNEIIVFLSGIKDTESLSGIIASIEMQISNAINIASAKQDTLISGKNIKTINGESILGEGNINIEGGSEIPDLEGYATEEYVDNAVEAVNVKGDDGYVYSNGEKVDMRFTRSLIPVGTSIPAKANLNTVEYLKVGKYYCSLNVDAKTITNCPTANAFMMEVFNPLSTVVDNEVDSTYVYRIRILTEYSTGIQYVQYCTVGSTANKWTYDSWYVCPRTKFTLNSSKNDGSAALGSATQGVYINAEGTFVKMSYTLGKSVPSSAVFTDTKVTAVGNHYTPVEDESVVIEAPDGEVVIGLKRDAAGHVVGVISTPMSGGGSSEYESNIEDKTLAMPNAVGGIAKGTTISALEGKTYNEMFDDLLFPTVNPTFTAPSASIAFKNYNSTQEVGATGPTVSNFTVGYNAGAITLNGVKQSNRGGTQDTANSFIYVNGSASNKTLPSKVTLGSTTFKYRAAFAEGPQPKNNKGGDYSTPLAAGTVDSSAITLNGTYPWYASTSSATSTNPVVKQSLVAWNTTAGNMSTGQFTVQPSGTLPQVFKLPRQIKTLQLKNALNGQMEDVANIATDYTESTETINIGGTNVTYYVYTYKGSTRGSVTLLAKF